MRKKRKSQKEQKTKKTYNKINSNKITQGYLKDCLNYNPETGILTWKYRPESHFKTKSAQKCINTRHFKKTAGSKESTGYLSIRINTKPYLAHRLAWLYMFGYLPENQIDHKNRIRTDNRIKNLREASQQCQSRNSMVRNTNTSGVTGVSFQKGLAKWAPRITINYKDINLGVFENFDDAVMARWKGEVLYKFPNCCTSSSSYNYLKNKGLV